LFGDPLLASAGLDRLFHGLHIEGTWIFELKAANNLE
jgi:hypothetical protein